ncbi:hypothetical protein ILYODFUR_031079 [Ilyodon furcidens]|uniref:Uncharacterized protein n=1 Tax=Ilyodon furcidens TaxID=33524 RepID=A0ABV0SQL7_9TELE
MADLLSRSTPDSDSDYVQDPSEPDLILMLHSPLQAAVSPKSLKQHLHGTLHLTNSVSSFGRNGPPESRMILCSFTVQVLVLTFPGPKEHFVCKALSHLLCTYRHFIPAGCCV